MRIHALRTGSVRIRPSQARRRPGGLLRVLADDSWTPWLPIYAWAIEHPEGLIVVDTGESARATMPGHFPVWHPYYRWAVEFDVRPDEELGPLLAGIGARSADVRLAILTHLHTDHAGGLSHLEGARVLVSRDAYRAATGVAGRLLGYQPEHWPAWFKPEFVEWSSGPVGPFATSSALTRAGDVLAVPTQGHTPGHLSVLVRDGGRSFLLAGDTSYSEATLVEGVADGLTLRPATLRRTQRMIRELATVEPLVYLPTHDPDAASRLAETKALSPDPAAA